MSQINFYNKDSPYKLSFIFPDRGISDFLDKVESAGLISMYLGENWEELTAEHDSKFLEQLNLMIFCCLGEDKCDQLREGTSSHLWNIEISNEDVPFARYAVVFNDGDIIAHQVGSVFNMIKYVASRILSG